MSKDEQIAELRSALQVIESGMADATNGMGASYWPARQWLDKHNVYHDDLNELRVMHAVAKTALAVTHE